MSRIKHFAVTALLGLVALPVGAATVSTSWVQLRSTSQDDCIAIGERAIAAAGFQANVSRDRQSIFGWRGDEALTIRCIGAQRVAAIFAWVTDQSNDSAQLVEGVAEAYRIGQVPRGGNLTGGGGGGNLTGGGVVKR